MSLLDNFPHTVSTKTRRRTKGPTGGAKDSWVTTTGVSCWQQPASAAEVELGKRKGFKVTDKFYFTTDPGLTAKSVIIGTDGLRYEVRSGPKPDTTAGLGVAFKCFAEHVSTVNNNGREA